jgi:GNAT superfamily N-acetyltransferase
VTCRYTIRKAVRADLSALVAFTLQEAREAEHLALDTQAATLGVRCAFDEPSVAAYWVAEAQNGEIVASTSVVTEWSNYYGGKYWWVQSLFIAPEHRGGGLIDLLLNHLAAEAETAGALDLRLYVNSSNQRAIHAYERCSFNVAPYIIMRREVRPNTPLQSTSSATILR